VLRSLLLAALPAAAAAEDTAPGTAWAYRLTVTDEVSGRRAGPGAAPAAGATDERWEMSNLWVGRGDGRLEWRDALTLGGSVALRGTPEGATVLRAREAFARVSALSWLELEAGKRLVRWGTGYAFTPTGVLDPPRDPADPQDRLSANEGMLLARADVFHGPTALTVAVAAPRAWRSVGEPAPQRVVAGRLRTAVRGVEASLVARAAEGGGPAWGGNFTHVVGQRLEWHGELLVHPRRPGGRGTQDAGRATSGLLGLQYTFARGLNVVVEYYRDGNGRPRRSFGFARLSRAATDARVQPELIAVGALADGGLTLVPAVAWRPSGHARAYARVVLLAGPTGASVAGAPARLTLSLGVTVSF
jgi:hypothetical protein